jgi:hypothetical protein
MRKMAQKILVAVAVAFITPSSAVTPADARSKRSKLQTSRTDAGYSLDGRALGYPRTCGSNTFIDSSAGGPYCH